MAFQADDIQAIDEAIAAGALTVKIDGREITYRSMNELFRAKRHIEKSIAKANGKRASPFRAFSVSVNRGI